MFTMRYIAKDKPRYVICESADGWSIHAPGSTDEAIAHGDAPALVCGPWEDDEHMIPAWAWQAAEERA